MQLLERLADNEGISNSARKSSRPAQIKSIGSWRIHIEQSQVKKLILICVTSPDVARCRRSYCPISAPVVRTGVGMADLELICLQYSKSNRGHRKEDSLVQLSCLE
jgi:hypothetical protein